jgi:hypothetical protein
MAYTIFNTRNNELAIVEDGTIDNTTDLKLIGKNYAGYGEIQNENFVYLLENFAGANQPPRPITGQLWFDTDDGKVKAYDGNDEKVFVPLGNVHIGAKPTGAAITAANVSKGDLWWDDVTSQLYAHTGASTGDPFVLVGPKGAQDVRTDVIDALVYDSLFANQPDPTPYQHRILKGFMDDVVVFVASNDEFTLDDSNAISGFDRIKKGITLVNTENANDGVTSGNYSFHGSASNALRLNGVLGTEFVQRTNPVFATEVNIEDNDGLLIGPNNELILKVVGNEAIVESTITNAKLNFKVKDTGGSTVTPLTLTHNGPMPISDNNFDIGSTGLRWNEVFATKFRGIADEADSLLSNGTYKIADKNNTVNTIVTRDSVGDIFGTAFRGTHLYNSTDATAALTARVTTADGVQVADSSTYVNATIASTANKLALRDSNGELFATQFNGLATRSATLQVPTGVPDTYEHRLASISNSASTIVVRDENSKIYATEFVGSLNGQAASAAQWTTARTITVDGDASGVVSLDGSENVTLTLSTVGNSIALGTDTTGSYVKHVSVWNEDPYLNVYVNTTLDGTERETAAIQLGIDATTTNSANNLVARDASGDIFVSDISASLIGGTTITASTKFVGQVNDVGTDKDGYFDNLYAENISFGSSGSTLPITAGGTGATTASTARTNLDVYSTSEVDTAVTNAVGGVSTNSIVSGGTSATVTASAMTVVRDGSAHSTFTSDGITLSQGNFIGNLTGNAVTANYADLAEKYTAQEDLIPGTVVCISSSEEYEVEPSSQGRIAVGVISTDPALLMNDGLEGGVAVALKGRVPTRIMGAVKKGQAVYIFDNGTASTAINGGSMVGVALESNSSEEEKLVECILKV